MHISFYKRPLFLILIIYAVFLALYLKVPSAKQGDISFYADGKEHNIEGIVKSFPSSKENKKTFIVKVKSADAKQTGGYIYAYCKTCGEVLRGQNINFTAQLYKPEENTNIGSFNWAKYLARQYIFCQGDITQINTAGEDSKIWVFISKVRGSMLDVFNNNFPQPLAPVLSGITIGEKANIDRNLNVAFQDSGAMHLLVASGSNVGFVTLVVYFLCALFGLGRISSASLALSLALFYTLIAGGDAPLVRAYIMTLSSTAGFILGRKSGVLQGFVIAALAILIFSPQSIFDAGFQMSFLAALFIILLASNFKLSGKLPQSLSFVLRIFFVSFAAQAALMPIFTNYFYKVSLSAVFSNIILVPLSGVIMSGGFIVWAFSFMPAEFIFKASVVVLKELLFLFTFIVQFFAQMPWSKITVSALSPVSVEAYYIALLALLNLPLIKRKLIYLLCVSGIVSSLLLVGFLTQKEKAFILDCRYNYSLLIRDRNKTIVIGGGADAKTLSKAVLASGSGKIDCLFLNGLSKSSAFALKDLENVKIKQIYIPYGDIAEGAKELILQNGAPVKMLWAEDNVCGVRSKEAWYQNEDGTISTGGNNLSYEYKDISLSGNLKQIRQGGKLIEFKKEAL